MTADGKRGGPLLSLLATLCATIALANLLGWLFGVRLLVSVRPGLPAMVPMTALLSLLAACGLWMRARRPGGTNRAAAGPVAVAAMTVAIGACYLVGDAPAPFRLAQSGSEYPFSLSSPVTAAMFLVLALATLAVTGQRWLRAAQAAAVGVFLLALLNLAGYLFRDASLFAMLPGQGTSILTTLQVLLLAAGVLCMRAREGLLAAMTGTDASARISRRLLAAAFCVPVAAASVVIAAGRAGWFDVATTLPLFVWLLVVVLMLVIWRFALQLHAANAARLAAQAELSDALAELRAEQDHKDIFLATLAHELRNPMAPIRSAADVLRHGGAADPADRRRLGDILATQVGHVVHLVDDLLDTERLSRGRLVLDRHPLDLRGAIAEAHEQVRPLIARKGQRCDLHLPAQPVCVCGEHKRLVQVVANLLNNAAKYTPPGGAIDVRLAVTAHEAELAITDTGIGIPPELLPKVFDAFTQAALTPDRSEGGLGLGLPLVRQLTGLHAGQVRADSAGAGRGSTFTVTLPLLQRPAQAQAAAR